MIEAAPDDCCSCASNKLTKPLKNGCLLMNENGNRKNITMMIYEIFHMQRISYRL
jgi:hypothetical protein